MKASILARHRPLAQPGSPISDGCPIVSGSQHDGGFGSKMMFIGQAARELAKLKYCKPDRSRTLVVFTYTYNEAMSGGHLEFLPK